MVRIAGPDGAPVTQFAHLVDVWLSYDEADLARAGNDAGHFEVLALNTVTGEWSTNDLSTPRVDQANRQLHIVATALTQLALCAKLPASASTAPASTVWTVEGILEWLALGVVALVLGIGLVRTLRSPVAG